MNDRKESQNENEVWKDVVGYEGLYQVSNLGRIRKIRKKNLYSKNKMCPLISNIMTPRFVTGGYLSVRLTKDKKSKGKRVHRAVAEAFIQNPGKKETVNHKDFDKTNNHVSNLEWMTNAENINHAFKNGRFKSSSIRKRSIKKNMPLTSKYMGVHYDTKKDRFIAQITYNGVNNYLGTFKKEIDAAIAYKNKLKEYGLVQLSEKNGRLLQDK